MTLAEAEKALAEAETERNRQYWAFTRTARGKPPTREICALVYDLRDTVAKLRREARAQDATAAHGNE